MQEHLLIGKKNDDFKIQAPLELGLTLVTKFPHP